MYVDDKFSKSFNSYFGEDAVYNFIKIMIKESKYCSDVMKKHFNKEIFETSTKSWIYDNDHVDRDVKGRDNCHITLKYRQSAHRGFNIKVKLNHKFPIVFYNLKDYG